jgi:hypothetical protein
MPINLGGTLDHSPALVELSVNDQPPNCELQQFNRRD